jgi:TPR repeat protein
MSLLKLFFMLSVNSKSYSLKEKYNDYRFLSGVNQKNPKNIEFFNLIEGIIHETSFDIDKQIQSIECLTKEFRNSLDKNKTEELEAFNTIERLRSLYLLHQAEDGDTQCLQDLECLAKEKQNACAINNLAFLYYKGQGVNCNVDYAIALYYKAIELGNISAINNLAFLYQEGEKVERNYEKAIKLYYKAIELGNINAINNLAFLYKNGRGVIQDFEKAKELYSQAAQLGSLDAEEALFEMSDAYEGDSLFKKADHWINKVLFEK